MSWLSRLFGKKKKKITSDSTLAEAFHTTKIDEDEFNQIQERLGFRKKPEKASDIMVNSDLAFREPAWKRIKEIESKLKIKPEDFKDLSFEDSVDMSTISFEGISEDAKREIIKIVKEDRMRKINN